MLPYLKIPFSIPIQTLVPGKLLHILQNMSVISSVKPSCDAEVEPPCFTHQD